MKECKIKISKDGIRWYNSNNQLHREDGPAVQCVNSDKAWYINGRELTEKQFKKWELDGQKLAEKEMY